MNRGNAMNQASDGLLLRRLARSVHRLLINRKINYVMPRPLHLNLTALLKPPPLLLLPKTISSKPQMDRSVTQSNELTVSMQPPSAANKEETAISSKLQMSAWSTDELTTL